MQRAVFLDRDGVINEERHYVYRVDDFAFIAGVFAALRAIEEAGYLLVIVTNQSAIGRGMCSEAEYQRLTGWMLARLGERRIRIAGVYHCPHAPGAGCGCRKPAPGMVLSAARDHRIDLGCSWMIGDRPRDIEAGWKAGVGRAIRLDPSHTGPARVRDRCYVCRDLLGAVPLIVGRGPDRSAAGGAGRTDRAASPSGSGQRGPSIRNGRH